jgi:peroxiredoxin
MMRAVMIAMLAMSAAGCSKAADRGPPAKHAPTPKPTTDTPADQLGTLAPGTGLAVGQHVPDVQALDLDGKPVRLADLVAKGPLLLVFYRGGWCPYCNFEIHEMTTAYPEYRKRGVLPVAVSVDVPEEGAKTSATYTIPFPVLSDSPLAFINAFHVANHVDDATLAKMKKFGVDLEKSSGQTHHTIAMPALFLIDTQGVIRWAHDDPSYTVRPSTAQILGAIDAAHLGSTP